MNRITNDMIDSQLYMINSYIEDNDIKIVVGSCYGYKQINLLYKKTTGERTLATGLTNRNVYDMLEFANDILYLEKKRG